MTIINTPSLRGVFSIVCLLADVMLIMTWQSPFVGDHDGYLRVLLQIVGDYPLVGVVTNKTKKLMQEIVVLEIIDRWYEAYHKPGTHPIEYY